MLQNYYDIACALGTAVWIKC